MKSTGKQTILVNDLKSNTKDLMTAADVAMKRVAPLWPLTHFVAVNPFLGYSESHFRDTCRQFHLKSDIETLMPLSYYRDLHKKERFSTALIETVLNEKGLQGKSSTWSVDEFLRLTRDCIESDLEDTGNPRIKTPFAFSIYIDAQEGTRWRSIIREEVAKWCAAFHDRSESMWAFPWKGDTFYEAWRKGIIYDKSLIFHGLKKTNSVFGKTPQDPDELIIYAQKYLQIPKEKLKDYFAQLLTILPGWSSYHRYLDREEELRGNEGKHLRELLAVLVSYELLLSNEYSSESFLFLKWQQSLESTDGESTKQSVSLSMELRYYWQRALEVATATEIYAKINSGQATLSPQETSAQAIFCIDVRSELLRRNIENVDKTISTYGYAGFFGIPISSIDENTTFEEARCPALLAPPVKVAYSHFHGTERERTKSTIKLRKGALSCFSFVETLGLGYFFKTIKDTLSGSDRNRDITNPASINCHETIDTLSEYLFQLLKGVGLTQNFAPLVLFCGHGSTTKNNAYGSALDCGACGGHAGDVNARLVADLLNKSEIRARLRNRGIDIPETTRVIAGLHDTTMDEVHLFESDLSIPKTWQKAIKNLKETLQRAGQQTLQFRRAKFEKNSSLDLDKLRTKSKDWSEVRPEWGLAGNAAFIIAPRSWTAQTDLQGRAFLHDYDSSKDPEGSILKSILGGPAAVGSWINLQYYGSTVDNHRMGSGNKAIHNVIGGIGVGLGNDNDLRSGLPFQSVHNGDNFTHEPTRLHVLIAASAGRIRSLVEELPEIKNLIRNEWIFVYSIEKGGESPERIVLK